MQVSMNGLRRNLSSDISELRELVLSVISGEHYDQEDLEEAMNNVIRDSNVLNCVFHNDDKDFTDMSDVEVEHIHNEN